MLTMRVSDILSFKRHFLNCQDPYDEKEAKIIDQPDIAHSVVQIVKLTELSSEFQAIH